MVQTKQPSHLAPVSKRSAVHQFEHEHIIRFKAAFKRRWNSVGLAIREYF